MRRQTDIRPIGAALYLLPVRTRVPLKFGPETLTEVTCARVRLTVRDRRGRVAHGWGETPLSVQWVWPSALPYRERHDALTALVARLAEAYAGLDMWGHPIEVGYAILEQVLPSVLSVHNRARPGQEPVPWLAALVCCSAYDLALHDAYGMLHRVPTYGTYGPEWMNRSLSELIGADDDSDAEFAEAYPSHYLVMPRPQHLPAWHLVGGLDPLGSSDLTGDEPQDGFPLLLADWIARDGLTCLKVKLRGNDADWDWHRLVRVGDIARLNGALWLSADFNCTVTEPAYVNEMLDRLRLEQPATSDMILYVEQPFPYDLHAFPIDVHSVSARKPLFLDESAHDWRFVRLGRSLGWTGVALKTCKTQTGALLSLCWAKAHGMALMVQDLTNPMLAQIPHVLLAAHAGTMMGVETNAMQFYPEASRPEERVHPGLYRRRHGQVDLSSLTGLGFCYRVDEIGRDLPEPVCVRGEIL